MARAKKVYYDIALAGATAAQIVALTVADRFGNILDALTALTAGASAEDKQNAALSAFFVPAASTDTGFGGTVPTFYVDFFRNSTLPALYLTSGGASVPSKQGLTNVYTSNPRVRVRHLATTGVTFRGTLYVQRQHSIEA